MSEKFQIKTPVFEGPLDVLLDLIEKRKKPHNNIDPLFCPPDKIFKAHIDILSDAVG